MSSIPRQLATFAAVLAVLYTGGFIAGQFIDTGSHAEAGGSGHGGGPAETHSGEHGAKRADPVRGLAVAEGGVRMVLETPELARDRGGRLSFRIVDPAGRAVRDFEVEHEKRMHLIVVRRDLSGFQHLHPAMDADGTWRTRVRLSEAGTYRVLADFTRGGAAATLGSDLRVDGDAALEPLPEPESAATTDGGYEVRLDAGAASAGREGELKFTIARGGETIRTEPYLGAGGHLVALREGDLAFLHVHPSGHDDTVAFAATFSTEGRYRLFLQFKHEGRVHTAAFTQPVS